MKRSKDHKGISVFYSYASVDKEWRDQLANHLVQLKRDELICEWHDQQILAGSDRIQVIDQAIRSADLILLLISADFLASETCYQIEMEQAMTRHQRGDACVVPIILRPCDWQRPPLAHLQCLPRNNQPITLWPNQDEAFANVVADIRRVVEDLFLSKPFVPRAVLPTIWNIPYPRNAFFTGREDILRQLHTQLQTSHAIALSQPQAISGLGGIGKTQIAIEYAYAFSQEYHAVLWAGAENQETLISSYVAIAELLKLPQKNAQDQTITVQVVKRWLQTQSKWLLILDNADDLTIISEFLPPTLGGHLLLTTRAQATGHLAQRMKIETFSAEQGALFLLRRAALIEPSGSLEQVSIEERELAKQVTQELGGLPLALDQAGAYLEETGSSLAEYQQIYQQHRTDLLKERRSLIADHPNPVATTWSLSFQRVEQKNLTAVELLRLCAYLAPDAIPEEIIIQGASHLGSLLEATVADPFLRGQAIEVLQAYSLVSRDPVTRTLSIHRLVQAVLRDGLSIETEKQWMQRAVLAVSKTWFSMPSSDDWVTKCERCLPHALLCATWIKQEQMTFPEAAGLLSEVGNYLKVCARYTEAESLLQHGLAIYEKIFGTEHPKVAKGLYLLGILYSHVSNYTQARPLYQRALAIYERYLDAQHPDTAESLNILQSLAKIYTNLGEDIQAEPLYQRALAIYEQQLGTDQSGIADCVNGLARIYVRQGKYAQAEPLHQRALAIYEQKSDAEIVPKDIYLQNLAGLYTHLGKYARAEPLYQRALAIRERHYGVEHPYTVSILDFLASLYEKQDKYAQAEVLYQRILAIYELRLTSYRNEAAIYFKRGYMYLWLKKCENACADFAKYASLQPGNVNAAWMVVYAALGRQRPGVEIAERLETIATLDPQCDEAYICRGVALGLRGKLQEGLTELEHALHLNSRSEDALFWKGMMCAYLGHYTMARESIEQALQARLPPILLTPLSWLEQDNPQFYQECAEPLLKRYELT